MQTKITKRSAPRRRRPYKRQSISKRLRFEVLERDNFKCRYCGNRAPDVVLHVDHVRAVANGGETSLGNLVTACFDCNSGKSDRRLSDHESSRPRDRYEQVQEVVQAAINDRRYYCIDELRYAERWGVDLSRLAWWTKSHISSRLQFERHLESVIDHARHESYSRSIKG